MKIQFGAWQYNTAAMILTQIYHTVILLLG